jgi:uncharacterized NAD-dependent epimerase/dehydratase family protein
MTRGNEPTRLDMAGLSGHDVRVAIVDSGVDHDHSGVGHIAGGADLSTGPEGRIIFGTDFTDRAGHGTACAGIIRKKAPEASIFSIRIFDESLQTEGRLLVAALRWAIDHRMDVVNMSLGTTDVAIRDALARICLQACDAGLILIAAESNEGVESYPAAFHEVIGVAAGKVYGRYSYFYRPGETIECVARGDQQRLCWVGPREIMAGGTSFAAPHIAGIVALIRQAHPGVNLREVRSILRENASDGEPEPVNTPGSVALTTHSATVQDPRTSAAPQSTRPYSWIGKVALYPFNKEMHALVRYADRLDFDIVAVADPVGKGLVGKDAGAAIGLPPVGVRIAPDLQHALGGADTLILGYVDRLGRISRRDVLRDSILTALKAGVSVFSLLPVPPAVYGDLHALAHEKRLKIAYPSVPLGVVQELLSKPPTRRPVDVPVLGVFGTSGQQGKFTVQLALRSELLKRGYRIGQIGTEHHSELFGMDFAFPIGYATPVDLPVQHYAPFLDIKMREICHGKRPDIILVGAQSGTIPYDVEEHAIHSLPSIAFLLGTKPDACILVVNSIDPHEYIQDTMNAMRALVKVPTILLAMGDKEKHIRAAYGRSWVAPRQMAPDGIRARLQKLEERFGLPAVGVVSADGAQTMADVVTRFFSTSRKEEQWPAENR